MAGGQVFFATNRSVVLQHGDCLALIWSVSNIKTIHLNGEPQIGEGEKPFCIQGDQPTLTVTFQDDSKTTYHLSIFVLLPSWLTATIFALACGVILLNRNQIKKISQHPLNSLALIGLTVIISAIFLTETRLLTDIIANEGWLLASGALEKLFGIVTLALFGFLLLIAILRNRAGSSPQNASAYFPFRLWIIGVLLTIIIVSGIILFVNPRGMYVSAAYKPHQLLLRQSKTEGYFNLSQTPDIAIMGSSRTFTISPDYIEGQSVHTAYNMAVEGGRIEDMLIQARQMDTLPPVMLIEIQQGLPREPNDIAFRAPLTWLRYMSYDTALLTIEKRLKGLLDLSQLSEAIYITRYQTIYQRQPEEWPLFESNGFAHRPLVTEAQLEQSILLDIGNIPPVRCDHIDQKSQDDMSELIGLADEQKTSLVFYVSPWHPLYSNALLKDDPQYQGCQQLFTEYMATLTQNHEQIFFLDFSQLAQTGDLDLSSQGYYDSQHMTEANSQRLIDRALPTLQTAYTLSAQRRQL